jgi:hypothetical protein
LNDVPGEKFVCLKCFANFKLFYDFMNDVKERQHINLFPIKQEPVEEPAAMIAVQFSHETIRMLGFSESEESMNEARRAKSSRNLLEKFSSSVQDSQVSTSVNIPSTSRPCLNRKRKYPTARKSTGGRRNLKKQDSQSSLDD